MTSPERVPAPARPVLRPARTEATRHKLFAASLEIIGERGPYSVTVDEIAAAARVSGSSSGPDTLAAAVFGATLTLGLDRHSFHPERGRDACMRTVMRSVAP